MRPIFDKNDVQIEYPYEIHHGEREAPELACPRCGHVQPRKKRMVCKSCNHLIPVEKSRQGWDNKNLTNSYREMAEVFYGDKPNREFKRSKGGFGYKVWIRNIIVTVLLSTIMVVPAVLGMRAYLGEKDWRKLEDRFEKVLGPNFHRVELAGTSKIAASPKPAAGTKSGAKKKPRRAGRKHR